MAGGRRRTWLVVPVLLLARPAAAVTHPDVVVLSRTPEGEAAAAAKAYANAFRSVGYPVSWVAPAGWVGSAGSVVVVPGEEAAALGGDVRDRLVAFVEGGGRLVTAGDSPLARALGLRFAGEPTEVAALSDDAAPGLAIQWKSPAAMRPFRPPAGAKVFARVRGREAPVVASFRHGLGTVLFLGVELDEENPLGTSRFPYFLQAVGSAFEAAPPLASPHLVVYADLSDHAGRDPEAIATDWRRRGIREVHLGTWDAVGGKLGLYERLIAACHRRGILVYAWFELPHVSRAFWDAHPEWREQTATGEDAHVDWRRLMALAIPECFDAVAHEVVGLLERFNWDGADLAEVYFESPMGLSRPDQLTPMNRVVRDGFRRRAGFDPKELFDPRSPRYFEKGPASLAEFMAYRRDEVVELHGRLLAVLDGVRARKPELDVVVTLVDALYDTDMRDFLGVDTARVAALARRFSFELQVEDPFTLWALGPERYAEIAGDYRRLVAPSQRLAVDVNVVPREETVRPTRQQTGLELYRLVAEARRAFAKVCLYSEASIYRQDGELLTSAMAAAGVKRSGDRLVVVESDGTVELATGPDAPAVRLDGREWPAVRAESALLPRGRHTVEWDANRTPVYGLRLTGLSGALLDATVREAALIVRVTSPARGFVELSSAPSRAELDGKPFPPTAAKSDGSFVLAVPPGEHVLLVAP